MTSRRRFLFKGNGVTLKEMSDGGFLLRCTRPTDRKQVLRCDREHAMQEAMKAAQAVLSGDGNACAEPAVRVAFVEAIKASRGNAETKARYLRGANAFIAWLETNHPQATRWSQVRPSMIRSWFHSMESDGKAHDTLRLALVPLKQTSAFWASEYPQKFQDVARLAKLRLPTPLPKPVVALSQEQARAVLEWIRLNDPLLYPMLRLCGTAGLRIREAAAIRHCDVDYAAGTVSVAETPWHKPKNRPSHRTIPVPLESLAVILECVGKSAVQGATAETYLFYGSNGQPWTKESLDRRCMRTLRRLRAAFAARCVRPALALPQDFTLRRLRATFMTLARNAGANRDMIKRQFGHAPGDILGEHYEAVTPADLRREVLDPFERFWKNSGSPHNQAAENATVTGH